MKGKLITIYGINNIGKTTHSELLVERLIKEGHKSIYVKYPKYDIEPTGPFLWNHLRNPGGQDISEYELQLWFVLNRFQFQPEMEKLLKEGYIVVAEDYIGTGIAWGISKGLDEKWLLKVNEGLIKEDFAILMEGERVLTAKEKVHVHEQNEKLIKKCEKVHSNLADKYGWKRVQIQKEIHETAELIWKVVDDFLKRR
jgi:thymidylate kinase